MKSTKKKLYKLYRLIFIGFIAACFISYLPARGMAAEKQGPTIKQLAAGEGGGWVPPSIEELTQGKVKIGDLITKDNVDLVKDYIAPSLYACVKDGMVLRMANNVPPEKFATKFFWEATAKNLGKAVGDQNGTVRLKDGSVWPGGLPFPEPKTPLEAMANIKFGTVWDDFLCVSSHSRFVGKDGKLEKELVGQVMEVKATGRLKVPPLGVVPGYDDTQWRHIVVIQTPRELKGLGQLTIRHYDEYKQADEGFAYLAAFKRCIRVSATTYQDNVAGMDYAYGDIYGIRDPYAGWNFKSLTKKFMLVPEPKLANPCVIGEDDRVNPQFQYDHGVVYPRIGWVIAPVSIIDATPTIKHIYGQKTLFLLSPPYWGTISPVYCTDMYDRQMKLWKGYVCSKETVTQDGIDYGSTDGMYVFHDLQTSHSSQSVQIHRPNRGRDLETLNLNTLLKFGK